MKSKFTLLAPPHECEYLPGRVSQHYYEVVSEMTRDEYLSRMKQGWRRFGYSLFRPMCPACRMCQSLRVPVETFRPDRSQRRAWKANDCDVRIAIAPPARSAEKIALYAEFHRYQHVAKGWPAPEGGQLESFVENPFATEEWCYYLGDRLVGVGYVDVLRDGLSAIYFYYDPEERDRSLGTFNVLSVLEAARVLQLPHVYLGYYVEGCRSLEYKARFRPNEVLGADGTWRPFIP
jgi:arginyl-tRNA--protein-N-Asp/Glu arginylyltransferase